MISTDILRLYKDSRARFREERKTSDRKTRFKLGAVVRNATKEAREQITEMRERRATLLDRFGHCDGFREHLPRA